MSRLPFHRRLLQAWADLRLPIKGLVVISIPMVALTIASATFKLLDAGRHRAQHLMLQAEEVRDSVQTIGGLLEEADVGVRGYLLTRRDSFLQPFLIARARLPHALDQLEERLRDREAERARLPLLRALVADRLRALESLRRYAEGAGVARDTLGERLLVTGRAVGISLQQELASLEQAERVRLTGHLREMERLDGLVEIVVPSSAFLGLALALIAGFLLTTGVVHRVQQLHANAHRLASGLPVVPLPPAADEIGRLGRSLVEAAAVLEERQQAWRTARDEADSASRAKSEFLSRMSHELRTPLNAIIGFGQLLEMTELEADQRECARQILKGGHHLLQLINEILEISRVETARLDVSPEPVLVTEVIAEAIDLARPLGVERHVTIANEVAGDIFATADRQRLKQVLLNLLSNAVKYNRDGGSVHVACSSLGQRVRISVRDTGHGIPEALRSRLFLPFERLDAEARGIEGTGLGLSLSRGLVQRMGGTMGVDSVEGQGSTFWLDLPTATSPADGLSPHAPPVLGGIAGATRVILHIEDNLANVRLVEQLFSRDPGVRLLPAMQGQLGLELAIEHRPDLILLDLNLPDIHGFELLRRLRDHPSTRQVPVVVVSADATEGQLERALALGAAAYLPKPLDVPAFVTTVNERLAAA